MSCAVESGRRACGWAAPGRGPAAFWAGRALLPAGVLALGLFLPLLWITPASAQAAPAAAGAGNRGEAGGSGRAEALALANRVEQSFSRVSSFKARFTEATVSVGGLSRRRRGTVYYARPGRMRWEFAAPDGQTIVSDGKLIYSYDPDLREVAEMPLGRALKSNVAAFLLGLQGLRASFDCSIPQAPAHDGLVHLRLVPKEGGEPVKVGFNPRTYLPMSVAMRDALGDSTEVRFEGVQVNLALDPSLFVFDAPAGADVVRLPDLP